MTPTQLINLRKSNQKPDESVLVYTYPFTAMPNMEPYLYPKKGDDLRGLFNLNVIVICRKRSLPWAQHLVKKIEEVQPKALHIKNMDTMQARRIV